MIGFGYCIVQSTIVVAAPLRVGENMVGLENFLKKISTGSAQAIGVVTFDQVHKRCADPACRLAARDSEYQVITLRQHGVSSSLPDSLRQTVAGQGRLPSTLTPIRYRTVTL